MCGIAKGEDLTGHGFELGSSMPDLKNAKLIYLKAILFVLILLTAAALLVHDNPSWRTAVLVALVAWSSARTYYFIFYVIENYVDGEYKFAGVTSFVMYILGVGKHP